MKKAFAKVLGAVLVIFGGLAINLGSLPVKAEAFSAEVTADNLEIFGGFAGFNAWYENVDIDNPNPDGSGEGLAKFIWKIILNIVSDVTLAAGYVAIGMVIYAGFLIMTAQGDPGRLQKGQKTLIAMAIGAAIAILATVLVRLVMELLA